MQKGPKLGPAKIFLARHGSSQWNIQKRISGQLDPPLSKKGEEQAEYLKCVMRSVGLSAIYSSPMTRSLETARQSAEDQGLTIHLKEAIKEINLGILQGRIPDESDLEAQFLFRQWEKDKIHFRIPGGETFLDLQKRVIPCLRDILDKEDGSTILIVGHRNTNHLILGDLIHLSLEDSLELNIKNKYLYEIIPGTMPRVNTIFLSGEKKGVRYDGLMA